MRKYFFYFLYEFQLFRELYEHITNQPRFNFYNIYYYIV
jgi:hypothetical protein